MRDQILGLLGKYLPGRLQSTGPTNILTKCPFHKEGKETKPSFSVNVERGIFHCFTCHVSGDIQKFLKMMSISDDTIERELSVIKPALERNREQWLMQKKNSFAGRDPFKADFALPEDLLGVYKYCPMKLVNDGFNPDLLQELGIGFDKNKNRILYPLRDMYGTLAGFSGGATLEGQIPKYHVYQGRRKGVDGRWKPGDFGEWFDDQFPGFICENHDFLWNFHRVMPKLIKQVNPVVYVVEGFKAAMWMIQSGFEMTVALMGSYLSDRQLQLLVRLGATVVLFLDNDAAGKKATANVGDLLWWPMYGRVMVVPYPKEDEDENTQPDDYEHDAIQTLVSRAMDFRKYFNEQNRTKQWQ